MVIVGLQCGHDGAVTILVDGAVRAHFELERKMRVRHLGPIYASLIDDALDYCGIPAEDIDLFAVCTSKGTGYRSNNRQRLRLHYDWSMAERLGEARFDRDMWELCASTAENPYLVIPESARQQQYLVNVEAPTNTPGIWRHPKGMDVIPELDRSAAEALFSSGDPTASYIAPLRVEFDGRSYPGIGVLHQLAHAAAAFYQSPFDQAPVLAHDNGDPTGGRRYTGGMLFHGSGNRLVPIWRSRIAAGPIYAGAARFLGLGQPAGPDRLMDLSAYGTPEFHDGRFIGDATVLQHLYAPDGLKESYRPQADWDGVRGWIHRVDSAAQAAGYEAAEAAFAPLGQQVAATAQKTFEELVLYSIRRLDQLLETAGRRTADLCLGGGCALNGPTNTRIVDETGFDRVFVPPSCDDGGLSTGAALLAYHHVLGHPRGDAPGLDQNTAHQGRAPDPREFVEAVARHKNEIAIEGHVDVPARAGADLAAGKVVALFHGRAESGPRALGHRSLLADPRDRAMLHRVNRITGREWWRPFDPACLAERLRDHFDAGPEHSPHGLFNYTVKGDGLGAVTHVDRTARTQTVSRDGGRFRRVIEAFEERTGVPVVLNTALSGPDEPLVDTPENAVQFFLNRRPDVLYLETIRITRKDG